MEVILLADVRSVGKRGELKKVSDGFARNFLLPKKLAIIVTTKVIAQFKHEESIHKSVDRKKAKHEIELVDTLRKEPLVFSEKANDEGTLFSGLSQEQIADKIETSYGVSIENKSIKIGEPIKKIGDHTVNVKIRGSDITMNITVKKQ